MAPTLCFQYEWWFEFISVEKPFIYFISSDSSCVFIIIFVVSIVSSTHQTPATEVSRKTRCFLICTVVLALYCYFHFRLFGYPHRWKPFHVPTLDCVTMWCLSQESVTLCNIYYLFILQFIVIFIRLYPLICLLLCAWKERWLKV